MKIISKLIIFLALAFSSAANAQSINGLPNFDTVFCPAWGAIAVRKATRWQCLPAGTSGYFLKTQGPNADPAWANPTAGGTVSSVGVSVPAYMTSAGGPVTTSGSIALTYNSQIANQIFASPFGASGVPQFRALDISDLPVVSVAKGGTNASVAGGTAIDNISAFAGTGILRRTGAAAYSQGAAVSNSELASMPANTIKMNNSGSAVTPSDVTIPNAVTALGFSGTPANVLYNNVTSNLTKSLNFGKGATIASAAVTDIWSPADGNYIPVSGVAAIGSFGTAPQAGATRVLLATGAFSIVNNSNIIVSGGTYVVAAGDLIRVIADTTTIARVTIYKGDGTAVVAAAAPKPHITILTSGTSWTSNAAHKWAKVTVIGGGGGGTGGGGGAAVKVYTLTPSTAYTYSVGGGGANGNASTSTAGGNSTFSDGTILITGGGGFATSSTPASIGGVATNGDMNIAGQTALSGVGGSSGLSYGVGAATGVAAQGYGGGGAGTAGGAGAVIIEEYY